MPPAILRVHVKIAPDFGGPHGRSRQISPSTGWIGDITCRESHQAYRLTSPAPELALRWPMTETHGLNLTTHRAPASVWDRRGGAGTREQLTMTRWLVGIGGGALALQGLRQRSVAGSVLAGLGGGLAWWALTGEG